MHIYTEIGSVLLKMDAVAQLFPQQYLETFKAKANVEKFIPDFDNAMGANVFHFRGLLYWPTFGQRCWLYYSPLVAKTFSFLSSSIWISVYQKLVLSSLE